MSDIWQYVHTRRHRQQRQRLEAEKKEVVVLKESYLHNLTLEIGKHKSNSILTLSLATSFLQICNNKQELNTIRIMLDNKIVLDS